MNEKPVDYLNGKLFPMILKFSIPAAVSLLITAVYNIVDRMLAQAAPLFSVCFQAKVKRIKCTNPLAMPLSWSAYLKSH